MAAGAMEEMTGVGVPQITRTPSRGSQKQRRLQDALYVITDTVRDPDQQYTQDLQKGIRETNEILLDATRGLEIIPGNDSGDDDETFQTPYLAPASPYQSVQSTQIPGQGWKRKPDTKDEPGSSLVPQNDDLNQPMKRARTRTQIGLQAAPSKDLSMLKPQPLQFQFPTHPETERSNQWFQNEFRKLFDRLEAFSQEYFGLHDLEEGEFHQPWAVGMTPEFLNYVEMVAEADPEMGGWDNILRCTKQRQWLIMAVLMRILNIKIFDTDLWGADKEEKKLLLGIERAFITREGFQRTALRAQTVRTIIGRGPLTRNFHEDTAKLTAQVALLLKPLTDFLYGLPPAKKVILPTMEEQYQALHNIIASAGYISLCIRLSSTIFYMTYVTPNDYYNPKEQYCTESEIYKASRDKVKANYDHDVEVWTHTDNELKKKLRLLKKSKKCDTKADQTLNAEKTAHEAHKPTPVERLYRAMAKICIWPNIRRFNPGGFSEHEQDNVPLEKREGSRIHEITKSAVVCYFGVESETTRRKTRVPLDDLVKDKERTFGTRMGASPGPWMYAAAAAVPIAVMLYTQSDWLQEYSGLLLDQLEGMRANVG